METPEHYRQAAANLGYSETEQNEALQEYLANGGVNLDPAKTAWCAGFVNASLEQSGVKGTNSLAARSFQNWGQPVQEPQVGDVAVFSRPSAGPQAGHVGFYAGTNPDGTIKVLGGNQGDKVSYSSYPDNRLLGYRRPSVDVRMASTGGVTTGSTNPMDVTGDPRTGAMDMPQQADFHGMDGSDYLHPAIKAILERQQQTQQPDLGNALLGMGMGILGAGGGPGAGNWFGAGVRGAAQMMSAGQPEKMTELQLLKANHELQTLEEKAQERRQKRAAMERLKETLPGKYHPAVEAGLFGKEAYAEVMGLTGTQDEYGTGAHFAQQGTWEDGVTPKWFMVRPSTSKAKPDLIPMDKGFEPPRGPSIAGAIEERKAWGRLRPETIANVNEGLTTVQSQLGETEALLTDFESGKFDNNVGPLRGRITQFYNPEVARLRMENINSRLRNLQVTNLAPVSNVEMDLMSQLYASPNMTVAQNIAVLRKLRKVQRAKTRALQGALQRLRTESFDEYMLNPPEIDVSAWDNEAESEPESAPVTADEEEDFSGAGPITIR
jgi:uncharacterized protein (TIGR02594 family)